MKAVSIVVAAWAMLLGPSVACADTAVPARGKPDAADQPLAVAIPAPELLTLDQAKQRYPGRLSRVVLDYLTIMDDVVNRDKQPAIPADAWEPLGRLIDRDRFRRVGNFGVRNDWPSYAQLLTRWANSSWWKGYIWRLREVPGKDGQPSLVYLESEERSSKAHPVRDDGDYSKLASIAVYEIDANNRIVGLYVYDQRPL